MCGIFQVPSYNYFLIPSNRFIDCSESAVCACSIQFNHSLICRSATTINALKNTNNNNLFAQCEFVFTFCKWATGSQFNVFVSKCLVLLVGVFFLSSLNACALLDSSQYSHNTFSIAFIHVSQLTYTNRDKTQTTHSIS